MGETVEEMVGHSNLLNNKVEGRKEEQMGVQKHNDSHLKAKRKHLRQAVIPLVLCKFAKKRCCISYFKLRKDNLTTNDFIETAQERLASNL